MLDRIRLKTKGFLVKDNVLPEIVLHDMRLFVLYEPTIHTKYDGGYVAKDYDEKPGCQFTSARIAALLQESIPLLKRYKYCRAWSFLYDEVCAGTGIHADPSFLQVNLWVTLDKCIIDPVKNGLILYNKKAPSHWTWDDYNNNIEKIQDFLKNSKGEVIANNIPYRYNRCVIFPGNTFHQTAGAQTIKGHLNKRINFTYLFKK